MAKDEFTNNDNDRYPSSDTDVENYFEQSTPSEESVFKQSEEKTGNVVLVFKKNRKKELHIGKKVYHFYGCQSLEVPREVIEHTDFENQAKYFTIKGER